MKLFVEVNSKDSLQALLESNASILVIGLKEFSGDRIYSVSFDELESIINSIHQHHKKVCLLFPYIILQTQFQEYTSQLAKIARLNIDFIACGDVGLGYFMRLNQTNAKLIFMNETMIANPFDAQTFLESGYDLITPAMDITYDKKLSFAQKMPSQALFQICGTHIISTSKRPLLSAYYDVIETPNAPKHVKLREHNREQYYFGLEDDQGFHVFHEQLLVLDHPSFLSCEYGYLSSLFVPIEETLHWIHLIESSEFTFENVVKSTSFSVYRGLEETDKGLEAGT
jgi:collagenase-like PrtC family protease